MTNESKSIVDETPAPEPQPPEAPHPPTHAALMKHLDALIEGVPLALGDLSVTHLHALLGHLRHAHRILKS